MQESKEHPGGNIFRQKMKQMSSMFPAGVWGCYLESQVLKEDLKRLREKPWRRCSVNPRGEILFEEKKLHSDKNSIG